MPLTAAEFEEALKHTIAAQQPFFVGMLNQIASIEARQGKQAESIQDVRDKLYLLINLELVEQIHDLKSRLEELERERHERKGLIKAFDWVPKVIQYSAFFVLLVLAWASGKKGVLPHG